jgi:MinD-like ATPase involved in chromosome partitioning or flagellar assembly
MALIALGSLHGSPGATTTSVALAAMWCRPSTKAILVEADPDGGMLAARYGLPVESGLTALAGRARRELGTTDVDAALQELPGGLPVVLADPAADVASAALLAGGERLADLLSMLPCTDVVVDVGRLRPSSPAGPMVERADVVLVVTRPRVDELAVVSRRLSKSVTTRLRLVLVGARPYSAAQVEAALGVDVVGVVTDDARGAEALNGRPGVSSRRSALLKSVSALAETLSASLDSADALALAEVSAS